MEVPSLAVEAGDLAAVEHDRLQRGVRAWQLAELAVAGQLDSQVKPLQARGRVEQQRVDTGPVGAGVEALHRAPAQPKGRLAVADPEQVNAAARPLGGHR